MPKSKKIIIDEHENMEPVYLQKKGRFVMYTVIVLGILIVSCIGAGIVKREHEKQRINDIINSIQNEIYIKQCNLDKMYCCGYKDKEACKKWTDANCTEDDGSLKINCDIKY